MIASSLAEASSTSFDRRVKLHRGQGNQRRDTHFLVHMKSTCIRYQNADFQA